MAGGLDQRAAPEFGNDLFLGRGGCVGWGLGWAWLNRTVTGLTDSHYTRPPVGTEFVTATRQLRFRAAIRTAIMSGCISSPSHRLRAAGGRRRPAPVRPAGRRAQSQPPSTAARDPAAGHRDRAEGTDRHQGRAGQRDGRHRRDPHRQPACASSATRRSSRPTRSSPSSPRARSATRASAASARARPTRRSPPTSTACRS